MQNAKSQKAITKKANFYFGASLLVLIMTTALLLLMLNNQNKVNTEAESLLYDTESLTQMGDKLQARLNIIESEGGTQNLDSVLPNGLDINEITRSFDKYFSDIGEGALNTSLNFSAASIDELTGLHYVDANLSIKSDEQNFYDFLRFVETSGVSENSTRSLMEIRSINISFSNATEDSFAYNVTVRIYYKDSAKSSNSENE